MRATAVSRASRALKQRTSATSTISPLNHHHHHHPAVQTTARTSSTAQQQQQQYNQRRAPSTTRNLSSTRARLTTSTSNNPNPTPPPPTQPTTTRESILPTYYEIFPSSLGASAIPPSGPFALDLSALKREFLALQGKAHPDVAPEGQKRQAEALSARINEAYRTLRDPLLRAQYLLSLRGVDVAEDEGAKVDDAELLMEVLETREVIEEAQCEEDLVGLREENEERVRRSEEVLGEAFAREDVEAAKTEAVRLRYWINIRESIHAWEKGKPVVLVH